MRKYLHLLSLLCLILAELLHCNSHNKGKDAPKKKEHKAGHHMKVARRSDSELPYDRTIIPGTVSGSLEHLESPFEDDYSAQYSRKDDKKKKRSSTPHLTNLQMLELDSSNGFQKAIEKDISDLNNPQENDLSKRSYSAVFVDQKHDHPLVESDSNTSQIIQSDRNSNSSVYGAPLFNEVNGTELKSAYELLSQTAQYYSGYIIEEMRTVARIQEEFAFRDCEASNNCTSLPEDKHVARGPDNSSHGDNVTCNGWSNWSVCSDSCANGTSTRYRDCYDSQGTKTPIHEIRPCFNPDCLYCNDWSKPSQCSKPCGVGTQSKERVCQMKNGSSNVESKEESCNVHPCKTECQPWGLWSNCSKPCGNGVTIRMRNCTLPDSSLKTFYEHKVCNTQPCDTPVISVAAQKSQDYPESSDQREECLSTYFSFEKFQDSVNSLYDESEEHNDAEIKNVVMFNGNYSCGYSGLFSQQYSLLQFYDDVFRNFYKSEISVSMWVNPGDKTASSSSHNQSLIRLRSRYYDYGDYSLELVSGNRLSWTVRNKTTLSSLSGISASKLNPGFWYHIYISYVGPEKQVEVYLNGKKEKLEMESTNYKPDNATPNNDTELINSQFQGIGNSPSLDQPFYGLMDEIYIFKCHLTKKEIEAVANSCRFRTNMGCPSPLQGLCPNCPPCKANWEHETMPPILLIPTPLFTSKNSS